MPYIIKDPSGKTIGRAVDEGEEIVGMFIGAGLILIVGVILAPIIFAVAVFPLGVSAWQYSWNLATQVPISPFPNLNGVLVIVGIAFIGAFSRFHRVIVFTVLGGVSLVQHTYLGLASILVVGLSLLVPVLAIDLIIFCFQWLFSIDQNQFPVSEFLVHGFLNLEGLIQEFQQPALLYPFFYPLAWVVSIIFVFIVGLLGGGLSSTAHKKNLRRILVPGAHRGAMNHYVLIAVASWTGIVLLKGGWPLVELPAWSDQGTLFLFGTLLGTFIWSCMYGFYMVFVRKEGLGKALSRLDAEIE